jgi:hypothetical protein
MTTFLQRILLAGLLVPTVAVVVLAQAPAASPIYIHAGALLDRPGETPRGPSTVIVRGNRI